MLPCVADAFENDAELIINRKKNQFRWWAHIRSPVLGVHQCRLGYLRLEGQLFWAVYFDDLPFITRNAVSLTGIKTPDFT